MTMVDLVTETGTHPAIVELRFRQMSKRKNTKYQPLIFAGDMPGLNLAQQEDDGRMAATDEEVLLQSVSA